jgi:L,D-peptidoglycan transpeptidase YkuD (ErfK/YbiS/YcfS/YnhG family)
MPRLRVTLLAGALALGAVAGVAPTASGAVRCAVPGPIETRPQVVLVQTSGTHATVTACTRRKDGSYVRALGPYRARIGYNGLAPAGGKREGDGRTPRGNFALRTGFGTATDPGTDVNWLKVDSKDVWVDDPASKLYNRHARLPAKGRWTSAERMDQAAYRYAQVIGYNPRNTPGRGSAIFLHLSTGGATSGCVSLSSGHLLSVLRWERPGAWIGIHPA